eukprot:CAMPEP_0114558802 /NCGR_PEP_ID=MMETSP0114-20121206/10580_1 /TAXON_ID=31324 /ORGANISM="Goniomonas sp, Strain m" /LENGTH=179 /DNA_ID=CAMNT_0001744225 /DNA_START=23 /DNA_END=562 /DNA_ORIENTATION=-
MAADDSEWAAERIAEANRHKTEGNEHLKQGNLKKALWSYHNIWLNVGGLKQSAGPAGMVPDQRKLTEAQKASISASVDELLTAMELNKAMVYIKQEEWGKGFDACNKVLQKQPTNAKALCRAGVCKMNSADLDVAKDLLAQANSAAPGDPGIALAQKQLAAKFKAQDAKDRKAWGGKLF